MPEGLRFTDASSRPDQRAPAQPRVALVSRQSAAAAKLLRTLDQYGFAVQELSELPPVSRRAGHDLVVCDLPPSHSDAVLSYCAANNATSRAGVVVLHARHDPEYVVQALELGADDALCAPHSVREVIARVRAVLRRRTRGQYAANRPRWFGDIRYDPHSLVVSGPLGEAKLTVAQARLLCALDDRCGEVASRTELLEFIYGDEADCFDRAVDCHICRLRRRLARVSRRSMIESYSGVGYRLLVAA